jgi:hypothetical protein
MRVCTFLLVASMLGGCGKSGDTEGGEVTPDSDLRKLVSAVITSFQEEIEATCPCQVEKGAFPTNEACLERLSHDDSIVGCATEKLRVNEDREMRVALHCAIGRFRARADCVDESGCDDNALADCYDAVDECPMVDPQAWTPVVTECPGGSLLGR